MSYSFHVRGASKAEAKAKVAAQFDEVVQRDPNHQHDRALAEATVSAHLDLMVDDDSRDVSVSVNGSLSGTWQGTEVVAISGASFGVSVGYTARAAA